MSDLSESVILRIETTARDMGRWGVTAGYYQALLNICASWRSQRAEIERLTEDNRVNWQEAVRQRARAEWSERCNAGASEYLAGVTAERDRTQGLLEKAYDEIYALRHRLEGLA